MTRAARATSAMRPLAQRILPGRATASDAVPAVAPVLLPFSPLTPPPPALSLLSLSR
jgi:hypothetical protein